MAKSNKFPPLTINKNFAITDRYYNIPHKGEATDGYKYCNLVSTSGSVFGYDLEAVN